MYAGDNRADYRRPRTFTGNELRAKMFPEVRWAVDGLIPSGVTLFGGREKMGKSWLAFGLCIAVATGGYALGKLPVEQGEALYLSLEDYERRLQRRLRKLASDDTDLSDFYYAYEWEPADRGGVAHLDEWLYEHERCRLVVIDTLKRIRPHTSGKRNMYDEDYEAVQPFVPIAARHNTAILLVHHLNQQSEPHDVLDAFTGSTGLTAAAEGFLLLTRKRGDADAFLMADGKDLEEPQDLALGWDAATCAWTIQGDAASYRMHKERREIVELLEREGEPTGPKYVADALGRDYAAIRRMMNRMADAGELKREGYGKYVVGLGAGLTSHTSHTSTNGSGVTGVTTVTPPNKRSDSNTDKRHSQGGPDSEQDASGAEIAPPAELRSRSEGKAMHGMQPSLPRYKEPTEQGESPNGACSSEPLTTEEVREFKRLRTLMTTEEARAEVLAKRRR